MKLLLLLTLLITLALALDELHPRQAGGARGGSRARKRTSRPKRITGEARASGAARRPANAPARYKVDTDRPTRKRSKSVLTRLPVELIDIDALGLRRRRDAWQEGARVAAALRRQATANDFYECQNTVGSSPFFFVPVRRRGACADVACRLRGETAWVQGGGRRMLRAGRRGEGLRNTPD